MAEPIWLQKATDLIGLYEIEGEKDNDIVISMARICGGKIAKTYKHDSVPWCAMFVNYALIVSDLPGNDSLWALDFRKYGTKLAKPAVGAIATMKRTGGGHVFFVVGKTKEGKIVGRGGNQNDMVCDSTFIANDLAYNWPKNGGTPDYNVPVLKSIVRSHRPATMAMIGGSELPTAVAFAELPEVDPFAPTGWKLIASRAIGYATAGISGISTFFTWLLGASPKVVEQIEVVKDSADNVIHATKEIIKVTPDGTFTQIVTFISSPGFLTVALAVVTAAWFTSYLLTRKS